VFALDCFPPRRPQELSLPVQEEHLYHLTNSLTRQLTKMTSEKFDQEANQLELKRTISEGSSQENEHRIDALTPEEQKKVIWRIDVRLVLTLGFMYCVSLMDRTSMYSAAYNLLDVRDTC